MPKEEAVNTTETITYRDGLLSVRGRATVATLAGTPADLRGLADRLVQLAERAEAWRPPAPTEEDR